MTDQRLRDLERDAALGDLHAQARLLLERVRVGDLTEERLRLAAYLGHLPAQLALGPEAPAADTGSVVGLVLGLKPYGPQAFIRAAVTAAWLTPDARDATLLDPLRGWLRCPCEEHADAVQRSARQSRVGRWDLAHVGSALNLTKSVVLRLASLASPIGSVQLCPPPHPPLERAAPLDRAPADAAVRTAVVSALLPWALGRGDPVLDGTLPPVTS